MNVLRAPLFVGLLCVTLPFGAWLNVTSVRRAGSVVEAGPMLEPRSGHTATVLSDGRVLVIGGMRRNHQFYRSAEIYDPKTSRFERAGELNTARVGHIAVLLPSRKVLIAGGWAAFDCTSSAEVYDPITGKSIAIANMTARRGDPSATVLSDGNILIAGGADHDTPGGISSAEIFHPDTLSFEQVGSMHYGRISHTATLLRDGRVLIVGGRGDGVTATAELYDPTKKKFTKTGTLTTARYKHTAGLLSDGRVLIAGGSDERDGRGTMSSTEVYDPRTGKFSAAAPLNQPRYKLPPEAVSLSPERLLIAGGSKQVEVYDGTTGKFLVVGGQMSGPWHFMTESRLQNGEVLLAGGYADSDQATAQTWLYRP